MRQMMKLSGVVLLAVFACHGPLSARVQNAAAEPPMGQPNMVIKVYAVADLIVDAPPRPLHSAATPPTQLGLPRADPFAGGGFGGAGGGGVADTQAALAGTAAQAKSGTGEVGGASARAGRDVESTRSAGFYGITALGHLIMQTVAIDSWSLNGGTAQMQAYGEVLVISATPETHKAIESLLTDLRSRLDSNRLILVELRTLLVQADAVGPQTLSDPKEIDALLLKYAEETSWYVASGATGQTLHVLAGQVRSTRTEVQPIVGTNAQAIQAINTLLLGGFAAEFVVASGSDPETFRLDLQGSFGLPLTVPEDELGRIMIPELFSTTVAQFTSTINLSSGKLALISTATLDPSGKEPSKRLLVFARVTRQTP